MIAGAVEASRCLRLSRAGVKGVAFLATMATGLLAARTSGPAMAIPVAVSAAARARIIPVNIILTITNFQFGRGVCCEECQDKQRHGSFVWVSEQFSVTHNIVGLQHGK